MKDPIPTFTTFVERIHAAHPNLAYIHAIEPRFHGPKEPRINGPADANPTPQDNTQSNETLRKVAGDIPYVTAGGFDLASATSAVEKYGGLVAFGRHFIANPDLPLRLKKEFPLTPYNRGTFYTPEAAAGYIDYPFVNEVVPLKA